MHFILTTNMSHWPNYIKSKAITIIVLSFWCFLAYSIPTAPYSTEGCFISPEYLSGWGQMDFYIILIHLHRIVKFPWQIKALVKWLSIVLTLCPTRWSVWQPGKPSSPAGHNKQLGEPAYPWCCKNWTEKRGKRSRESCRRSREPRGMSDPEWPRPHQTVHSRVHL